MPAARPTTNVQVVALREGRSLPKPDRVVTEEPLQIRLAGPGEEPVDVAVTMRTPGHDIDLAVGYLVTEGLLASPADVAVVRTCPPPAGTGLPGNVVTVHLTGPVPLGAAGRNLAVTAACGTCGKTSIDAVEVACAPVGPGPVVDRSVLVGLPDRLRTAQHLFDRTGGVHAAGRFRPDGELVAAREDVGRHNAVDKLVGGALLAGDLPLSEEVLVVSGRVSFEIVQKAAVAGIGLIGAVSAPSSLAVDAARRLGITLVGFLRAGTGNVYSCPERVADR